MTFKKIYTTSSKSNNVRLYEVQYIAYYSGSVANTQTVLFKHDCSTV